AFKRRAAACGAATGHDGMSLQELLEVGRVAVACEVMQIRANKAGDRRHVRLAEPRGRLDQGVKDGFEVERRATDNFQHVSGGGLLWERLAQLVEEPRVLDCDDRLVGEGGNQLDLFRCKWLRYSSRYEDHPHDISIAQERSAERRPVAANPLSIMSGTLR